MSKFTPIERFTKKYRVAPSGCHEWFAATTQQGRPMFAAASNRCIPAQRFIWELRFGPIPVNHEVITTCGNRICVNPEHLVLVTIAEHRAARTPNRNVRSPKLLRAQRMIIWMQATFPHLANELEQIIIKMGRPPIINTIWQRICAARAAANSMEVP